MAVELMAPAGDWGSLTAALNNGADSVYFGVGALNMRARAAGNFTQEDLPEIVSRCHAVGAKSYLTLNTILFDQELSEAETLCKAAKAAAVDAVIAADPAVILAARKIGLPVHISVQANICNIEAVRFWAAYADVMVLARELSLSAIQKIIETIRLESICGPSGEFVAIEIFAHGALCVAFSGKCNMSLAIYGNGASANRGACNQPCRRRYRVTDLESGTELEMADHHVMSPKDICTLPFLNQILDAGVSVLKLEGRGRAADYTAVVTSVYRTAIDNWRAGIFLETVSDGMARLRTVFNRGFWEGGYYLGNPLGEWTSGGGSMATEQKIFVGEITRYYAKLGVAECRIRAEGFGTSDTLWVIGPTTGALRITPAEIRVGDEGVPAERAEVGDFAAFLVPEKVRFGDKVYLIRQNLSI